jgi:hypothetical protein
MIYMALSARDQRQIWLLDLCPYGCRGGEPLAETDALTALDQTLQALDALLATVPEDILTK